MLLAAEVACCCAMATEAGGKNHKRPSGLRNPGRRRDCLRRCDIGAERWRAVRAMNGRDPPGGEGKGTSIRGYLYSRDGLTRRPSLDYSQLNWPDGTPRTKVSNERVKVSRDLRVQAAGANNIRETHHQVPQLSLSQLPPPGDAVRLDPTRKTRSTPPLSLDQKVPGSMQEEPVPASARGEMEDQTACGHRPEPRGPLARGAS